MMSEFHNILHRLGEIWTARLIMFFVIGIPACVGIGFLIRGCGL